MKRIAYPLLVGLMLSVLLLPGCSVPEYRDAAPTAATLPQPPQVNMEAPNTDSVPLRSMEVTLYMRSADGAMLIPVEHRLSVEYTQDSAQALMDALLSAAEEGLVNPIPQGARILSVEHCNELVTVDLSIDAYNVDSESDLMWMEAAIANTLGSLPDVTHVNVLIGGRKYSLDGMSMGAMTAGETNATLLWAHSRTELEYIEKSDSTFQMERTAVAYYPALSGGHMLPVAVPVRYPANGAVQALLDTLSKLPEDTDGVRAAFDTTPQFGQNTVVTEDGRRVLMIDFSAESWASVQQNDPGMSCASAALTLVSFMPELDGVAFCAEGMLITEYDLAGERLLPEMGIITRESLRSRIGMAVDLYFGAPENDGLKRVTRVVSPMVEHYPRMLLSMLMQGPVAADGAVSAVPAGISTEDVLGISLQGNVMQVNLSGNFYRLCQSLDAAAERRLVYSMVNTLCNLDNVDAVQFFVEGAQVEVLSARVYLMVPLMANPGMANDAAMEPESIAEGV